MKIAVNSSLIVTLCSNPSTGFEWSDSAQISDQTVLQQIDHKFEPAEGRDKLPPLGAPAQETWTFKALKRGTSAISLEYGQPWEAGAKAAWTFVLTVVVK